MPQPADNEVRRPYSCASRRWRRWGIAMGEIVSSHQRGQPAVDLPTQLAVVRDAVVSHSIEHNQLPKAQLSRNGIAAISIVCVCAAATTITVASLQYWGTVKVAEAGVKKAEISAQAEVEKHKTWSKVASDAVRSLEEMGKAAIREARRRLSWPFGKQK